MVHASDGVGGSDREDGSDGKHSAAGTAEITVADGTTAERVGRTETATMAMDTPASATPASAATDAPATDMPATDLAATGSSTTERSSASRGLLTTGDMARLSSSTLRTVRFYEEEGILEPAVRGESGHRLFPKTELDKLRLVGELRLLGLPLDEIKTLFELKKTSPSGGQAADDALLRLETYLERVRERIDRLRGLEREIEDACAAIRRCQGCTDNHLFPESCGECRTMKDAGDLQPATTVLWGLKR